MAFAVGCDSEESAKGGHLGERRGEREMVVERRKRGRENLSGSYTNITLTRRIYEEKTVSRVDHDWQRVRSNASTILCEYLHPLLFVFISAHITKHAPGFEEKVKR